MSVHQVVCYEVSCDWSDRFGQQCSDTHHHRSPWVENVIADALRDGWMQVPLRGWLCPYHAKRAREAAVVDSQASGVPERRDTAPEAQEGTQRFWHPDAERGVCSFTDSEGRRCGELIVKHRDTWMHQRLITGQPGTPVEHEAQPGLSDEARRLAEVAPKPLALTKCAECHKPIIWTGSHGYVHVAGSHGHKAQS